jgi:hypothetical protein
MLDRVMTEYHKNRKDPSIKSYKRNAYKTGKAYKDFGDQFPAGKKKPLKLNPKAEALKKRAKDNHEKWHEQ